MKFVRYFPLLIVTILGLVLRIFLLSHYPPGFNPDEAAFGYNAYSLALTGRDEWGVDWYRLWIENLRSFGDYKLPLYAFLAVPAVKFFGLTEMATRLPNALVGSLAVPSLYLLARRLRIRPDISLASAFFLAVSPWHISLSRGAFEANMAATFFPLAASAVLSGSYISAAVIWAVGFYSYHSARLLTFPYLLIFWLQSPGRVVRRWGNLLLLFLLLLPGLISLAGSGSFRTADVSILSPTDNWAGVAATRFAARNNGLPDLLARLISNKATAVAKEFASNYLSFFSPQFLFSSGAGEGTYGLMPGIGLLYWVWLPLVAGFWIAFIRRPGRISRLLLLLLLIAPIPASLAKSPGFAANRTAVMIPWLTLIMGVGYGWWRDRIGSKLLPGLMAVTLISLVFFGLQYLYLSPQRIGADMKYGWKEAAARFLPLAGKYGEIRVGRALSEPHIFVAFYSGYPPGEYQQAAASWADFQARGFRYLDMYEGYRLGKYRFGDIYPGDPVSQNPVLFIGPPQSFPDNWPAYFSISYPDGRPAIVVAPSRP